MPPGYSSIFKQDIACQKEDLEELLYQYRSRLFDEEDLQGLKELEFKGPETRKISLNNLAVSHSSHRLARICGNQLERVSIPVFNCDKRSYEGWKTAFIGCVDKAPATPEYKLLQLRQYVNTYLTLLVVPAL